MGSLPGPHCIKLSGVNALILSKKVRMKAKLLTDIIVDLRDVWWHVETPHEVGLEVIEALARALVLRTMERLILRLLVLAVVTGHGLEHLSRTTC